MILFLYCRGDNDDDYRIELVTLHRALIPHRVRVCGQYVAQGLPAPLLSPLFGVLHLNDGTGWVGGEGGLSVTWCDWDSLSIVVL